MQSNNKQLILGFLVIVFVVVVTFLFFKLVVSSILSLEDKAEATVIGGIITFALGIFAFWREIRKSREEAHRQKKIEIYQIFFNIVSKMLRVVKTEDSDLNLFLQSDEFKEKMYEVREGILFYGSPKVIKAYSNWLMNSNSSQTQTQTQKEIFSSIGAVYLAMRADVGLSNFGLNSVNIHQIYVTDDLSQLK